MRNRAAIPFVRFCLGLALVGASIHTSLAPRAALGQTEQLEVGASIVDITPPVGYRSGGGYSEVISTDVHDPLYAKAIVLRQGSTLVAIVISDLLSVPDDLSAQARKIASERLEMPFENIIIAATHNHGSPEYWGSLRDIFHERAVAEHGSDRHEPIDYQQLLIAAWVDAIEQAHRKLAPATIGLATLEQPGLAFNRRFHMRDGSVRFNPGIGNPNIIRVAGPVDVDLPFLLFHSESEEQNAIASMTTFAIHTAVHGGTEFSGDFPAIIQQRLSDHFGPDFVSVFAEGTAGDINHIDVTATDPLRGRPEVERIGNQIADTLIEHLPDVDELTHPALAVASETAFAPFDPIDEARYEESLSILLNQSHLRIPFLEVVAAWRDCHRYYFTQKYEDLRKPLEVQAIRLNDDTAIVTLPHEVFVEIGMAIKASSPFRNTIVVSLANDVDFYIPTRRAFEEGSYEVTTCPSQPGCGELLLDAARRALHKVKDLGR